MINRVCKVASEYFTLGQIYLFDEIDLEEVTWYETVDDEGDKHTVSDSYLEECFNA